jgi:hypothetical protein
METTKTSQEVNGDCSEQKTELKSGDISEFGPVSDRDRAAAYYILLTGCRDSKLSEVSEPSTAENLAKLHHYFLHSEEAVPVSDELHATMLSQLMRIFSGDHFHDVGDSLIWEDLFGPGISAANDVSYNRLCGLSLLRFHQLIWAAGCKHPRVILPPAVAFYLMDRCSEASLFCYETTEANLAITLRDDMLFEMGYEISVNVPTIYCVDEDDKNR